MTKISEEENLNNFISIKMQVFEIVELTEFPLCAAMEVIWGTVVSDIINDSNEDKTYLLVDHDTRKIWAYNRPQSSLKTQIYGGILAGMLRQQLKLFYRVHSLDKLSPEDKEFQELMNKPFEPGRPKSITEFKPQKINKLERALANSLPEEKRRKLLNELELKLAIEARKKVESIMNKESVNEIAIDRKYLPEIFSAITLEISKNDGLPLIKSFVMEYFEEIGFNIKLYGTVVKFFFKKPRQT